MKLIRENLKEIFGAGHLPTDPGGQRFFLHLSQGEAHDNGLD